MRRFQLQRLRQAQGLLLRYRGDEVRVAMVTTMFYSCHSFVQSCVVVMDTEQQLFRDVSSIMSIDQSDWLLCNFQKNFFSCSERFRQLCRKGLEASNHHHISLPLPHPTTLTPSPDSLPTHPSPSLPPPNYPGQLDNPIPELVPVC